MVTEFSSISSETDDIRKILLTSLYERDAQRPRSQQVILGASALGGCSLRTVFEIVGQEPCNTVTDGLPAIMGTAIHGLIEDALTSRDPDRERFLTELTVPGIDNFLGDGHIDLYDRKLQRITDWKSTKLRGLRYFPKQAQRWQVQTYGYLAIRAGYPVKTVQLVAIPRDGGQNDIVVHEEPYDEAIALQAMSWLEHRYLDADHGVLPDPEYSGKFCTDYCLFYGDLCRGK